VGLSGVESALGHVSEITATVCPMDVRVDPERAEVVILRRPQDLDWHVAIVVGSHGAEVPAERDARQWRERLGLVGRHWVRRERAAAELGVGVKMIDKLRRAGHLRGLRVAHTNRAYVHREDLDELIGRRKQDQGAQS